MEQAAPAPAGMLSDGQARRLAWLVAALWLAMRLPWMGRSIWYDEWLRTRQWLTGHTAELAILHDVHNPLYNAFMYVWIRVFGDSPEAIRTPGVLAGAIATYALGRWAWGGVSRGAALAACAIVAVSPMHVRACVEAKNVSFVVAFCTLAAVAAARLAERPAWRRAAALGAAGALALWTSFLGFLVLLPLWGWLVASAFRRGDRRAVAGAMAALGLAVLLAAPILIYKAEHAEELARNYLEPFNPTQVWVLVTVWLSGLVGAVPEFRYQIGLSLLVAAALAAPLVLGWRAVRRAPGGGAIVAAFAGPIGVMAVASAVQLARHGPDPEQHIYQARNLAMVLPTFAMLVGAGLMAMPKGAARRALGPLLVGIGAAGTVMMFTVHRYRATTGPAAAPWPRLVEMMRQDSGGEPRILVARQSAFESAYYDPDLQFVHTGYKPLVPREVLGLARERGVRHVYVFDQLQWGRAMGDEYYRLLKTRLRLRPMFEKGVIRLWKVEATKLPWE
ncbi:MAG TPA: glycosyltransferase family 39 protein [Phycisphaerales bacterium]|nr:glycosyltransferase family 39 protein [Phycisphaerales bacterium]